MGQNNTEMDAESLQKTGRRRLDVCLVVSTIFLFVALTAVTAGGVICVLELRSKLDSTRPPVQVDTAKQTGDSSLPSYKQENFAYLQATANKLETATMRLAHIKYGAGTSVGSKFSFNEKQFSLRPLQPGNYFLYIELNITCTHKCNESDISVSVSDKLTCEVKLPAGIAPVTKTCWTVTYLVEQGLNTQMTVKPGLKDWQLNSKGSGVGMFLVG